ncbi:MAG TPA: amidohydrolase family protein [Longimicrobiaceae bacterium]|nr:amidohydrolase family protein [Longimicrobiaceae bacterium]
MDVERGTLLLDRTVLVAGERIARVAPSDSVRLAAGTRVVDGGGGYLIPGLWDMHVHLRSPAAERIDMPLFVAHGVTGVRDMGSDCLVPEQGPVCLPEMRDRQRRVESGELPGPRLLALSSWGVNGPAGLPDSLPRFYGAATAEDGRLLARHFAERGVDLVKVFGGIPREGFLGLADEVRKLGLSVAGHEPQGPSAVELSDAGMRSVEHARVFLHHCWGGAAEFWRTGTPRLSGTALRRRMVDDYDPAICRDVFGAFVRNGTWFVPTHLTRKTEAHAADPAMRRDPRRRFVPRAQWAAWEADMDRTDAADATSEGRRTRMDFYLKGLQATGDAHRAGVRVLAGTDAGDSFVYPGSSLHDELAELVAAGLTPAEALRAATVAGAEFLGRATDFGTVRAGRLADLVLLDADPLANVRNTARIRAVVLGGRLLDRAALDRLIAGAETAAAAEP